MAAELSFSSRSRTAPVTIMQVVIILALVAAATAAPSSHFNQFGANNVIEPQFPQGFVASGIVPTTYAAGIGAGNIQGTYFGGRPGTYVRQDNTFAAPAAIAAPAAVTTYSAFPQAVSTYSAFPQAVSTYSAFPQTFSGFPQTYSAFPQGISGVPAATYYSAAPAAVAYNPAAFPKSVQQNEGARLIEF